MKILWTGVALLALGMPFHAHAALGGQAASIEADRAHMKGTLQTRQNALYSVQEIKNSSGVLVREYVSPSGTVFGVGWQGMYVPDLQQLLGVYFEQYSQGVKVQKASYVGRRPLDLQLPGLVVQMSGHMRAMSGRAYLPELVPLGVKLEELR
jgi:hypothetical protein